MKVEIKVAVRDADEQKFIAAVTAEVKKFLTANEITQVTELIFARKSSYAGVRANAFSVRRWPDGHLEFWVNIKECSSSVNYALTRLASGLYYWGIKDKSIAKTVSKAEYIKSLGLTEENEVAEPVQRERATAPKVKKVSKDIIVQKHGVKIRGFHEHKLDERNFINHLVAFTESVLPEDNGFHDISFEKRSSKLSQFSNADLKKNGFDVSVSEVVSCDDKDKIGKVSIRFSFERFDRFASAMAVYKVMQMLKLDLDPVKALKPTAEQVTFAVLQSGMDSTQYAAMIALNAYAAQVTG